MTRRMQMLVALLAGVAGLPGAALAQTGLDGRVDRLEREMRAVQRKVFPGGNGQYFPPDNAPAEAPIQPPGQPATSAISDINARVASIESQLSTLTAQSEQDHHRLQLLEDAFAAYRRATDARIAALEQPAPGPPGVAPAPAPATLAPSKPAPAKPAAAAAPATKPVAASTPKPAPVDPKRAAQVAAIEKPATGDPADDLYVYGYRLWQAKLYPEAEVPLKQVVAKYPTHRRASWAQNLLGRTYLDEGRPSLASHAFYDNYKNFHEGERAPDSLYYLAVSLKQLGKPSADICKVYDELLDVYGSRIGAQMRADVAKGRAAEKCKAN